MRTISLIPWMKFPNDEYHYKKALMQFQMASLASITKLILDDVFISCICLHKYPVWFIAAGSAPSV